MCKQCAMNRRKKRGGKVGAANALGLDVQGLALMGVGAIGGAMANKLIVKIIKPKNDKAKDANLGILVGVAKAVIAGYFAYTTDDETIEKIATGVAAGGLLEASSYAFAVPLNAYNAVKGIGANGLYFPENSYNPMMPYQHVSGAYEYEPSVYVSGGMS